MKVRTSWRSRHYRAGEQVLVHSEDTVSVGTVDQKLSVNTYVVRMMSGELTFCARKDMVYPTKEFIEENPELFV